MTSSRPSPWWYVLYVVSCTSCLEICIFPGGLPHMGDLIWYYDTMARGEWNVNMTWAALVKAADLSSNNARSRLKQSWYIMFPSLAILTRNRHISIIILSLSNRHSILTSNNKLSQFTSAWIMAVSTCKWQKALSCDGKVSKSLSFIIACDVNKPCSPPVNLQRKNWNKRSIKKCFSSRMNEVILQNAIFKALFQYWERFIRYGITMIKIRRSDDRLICIMGIPISVGWHLYTCLEMG